MAIIINIDVMMAKRKMSLGELAWIKQDQLQCRRIRGKSGDHLPGAEDTVKQ